MVARCIFPDKNFRPFMAAENTAYKLLTDCGFEPNYSVVTGKCHVFRTYGKDDRACWKFDTWQEAAACLCE